MGIGNPRRSKMRLQYLGCPKRDDERADRPLERYRTRIDPPDLIAGGATARKETP
jgi:hypothetical protein